LAGNNNPTRAKVLGWIMTRTGESERAVTWLKQAVENFPDGDEKQSAAFTLFEAYLNTDDWRGAEDMWPLVRQRLTPREIPDWLGRVAVVAAKDGDKDAALRLWQAKSNLDRTDFRHLDELARLGLSQNLRAFYQRMAEDDPITWVPGAVLKLLH
jgi:tetratricopeptide (TPR) repeat protein